jgi:hypothetical protein
MRPSNTFVAAVEFFLGREVLPRTNGIHNTCTKAIEANTLDLAPFGGSTRALIYLHHLSL